METQEGTVPTQKTPRTRRMWRKIEEDALLKVMVTEISDKWSADNGFKPGFFTLLEKELEKVLPDSHIKASPHIDSKVKYWRQMYHKIFDILSLSGFGWDNVNKRIDVEESVWNEYEKAHPKKAKEVHGKRFPYYDEWKIVFGKDRATGVRAEDPTQMNEFEPSNTYEAEIGVEDPEQVVQPDPQQLYNEGVREDDFYEALYGDGYFHSTYPTMGSTPTGSTPRASTPTGSTPRTSTPTGSTPRTSTPPTFTPRTSPPFSSTPMESTPMDSTPLTSARRTSIPTSTTPPANAGAKKGKKRTRMGDEESMIGSMNNWMKESLGYMEKMANAMGYEKDISARRSTLPTELEKLDITLTQQFKLAAIIGEKDERVDQFLNTRDDLKQAWVEAVLNGHVFGPI